MGRPSVRQSCSPSFPAVELDLVWPRPAFAGFEQRLQAQQKDRPLGAAMVREFHRLLPTLVLDEDKSPVGFLPEIKAYCRADPFFGSLDDLPAHALAAIELENLHVETAVAKAELEHAAGLAFALRVGCPPSGKTFTRGQCLVNVVERRRLDSDLV